MIPPPKLRHLGTVKSHVRHQVDTGLVLGSRVGR